MLRTEFRLLDKSSYSQKMGAVLTIAVDGGKQQEQWQ